MEVSCVPSSHQYIGLISIPLDVHVQRSPFIQHGSVQDFKKLIEEASLVLEVPLEAGSTALQQATYIVNMAAKAKQSYSMKGYGQIMSSYQREIKAPLIAYVDKVMEGLAKKIGGGAVRY